jgi:pimeloyl-ACP methyl ester carboxylesterase
VYPESLETTDAKWPVVNVGNPSNTDADGMMEMLRHLASWGYIVIDNMDKQTGTGASVSKTLDEFLAISGQDGNLFHGKVDTGKIAIAGYSQGACAVALAATQYPNAGLYKAIYLCSCPQPQLGVNFKWGEYHFADFKAPVLTFAGTGDWDSKIIAPFEVFTQTFDEISDGVPAVQARRTGKDHEQMGGEGDPYMTAWFEYWLKDDREAGKVFLGEDAELLSNARWQDVRIKNF